GRVTQERPISMELLTPSVNIASNSRVFTTKDAPRFWINSSGADKAHVAVYKKDFLALLQANDKKKPAHEGESEGEESEATTEDSSTHLDISSDLNIYKPSDVDESALFKGMKP